MRTVSHRGREATVKTAGRSRHENQMPAMGPGRGRTRIIRRTLLMKMGPGAGGCQLQHFVDRSFRKTAFGGSFR